MSTFYGARRYNEMVPLQPNETARTRNKVMGGFRWVGMDGMDADPLAHSDVEHTEQPIEGPSGVKEAVDAFSQQAEMLTRSIGDSLLGMFAQSDYDDFDSSDPTGLRALL